MSERYVRPPLLAREPLPSWVVVWRLRLAALLLLALLVLGVLLLLRARAGTGGQDPGVEALVSALLR